MSRSEWLALMFPLREQGMTHQQIADELGCKVSTVRNYLTDPDGSKARERKRRRRKGQPSLRFPVDRVVSVLREWIERENSRPRTMVPDGRGAVSQLERETGVNARQIYAILNGERQFVTLGVVDALLCGIGRTDLFHTELADIYESA